MLNLDRGPAAAGPASRSAAAAPFGADPQSGDVRGRQAGTSRFADWLQQIEDEGDARGQTPGLRPPSRTGREKRPAGEAGGSPARADVADAPQPSPRVLSNTGDAAAVAGSTNAKEPEQVPDAGAAVVAAPVPVLLTPIVASVANDAGAGRRQHADGAADVTTPPALEEAPARVAAPPAGEAPPEAGGVGWPGAGPDRPVAPLATPQAPGAVAHRGQDDTMAMTRSGADPVAGVADPAEVVRRVHGETVPWVGQPEGVSAGREPGPVPGIQPAAATVDVPGNFQYPDGPKTAADAEGDVASEPGRPAEGRRPAAGSRHASMVPLPASGRVDVDLEQAPVHDGHSSKSATRTTDARDLAAGPDADTRSARSEAAALRAAIAAATAVSDGAAGVVGTVASGTNPGQSGDRPTGDGQAQSGAARDGHWRTIGPRGAAKAVVPPPSTRFVEQGDAAMVPHGTAVRGPSAAEGAPPALPGLPRAAHAVAAFHAVSVLTLQPTPAAELAVPAAAPLPAAFLDQELPMQIVKAVHLQWGQGGGEARVKLLPGFLGGLDVSVQVDGASVTAALSASTPEVREWMRTNEPALRQALADQGLTLDRLVIVEEEAQATDQDERGPDRGPEQETPRRPRQPSGQHTFELVV